QIAGGFAGQADEAVQLIHRAVGVDAQVVLGQALAAGESGLAAVALTRVDTVDGEPGLVEVIAHGPDSISPPPRSSAAERESRRSLHSGGRERCADSRK